MALEIVDPPEETAVSLTDAKEHLRITSETHDEYLTRLIHAATGVCEEMTGMRFIRQQWELRLDSFPTGKIEIGVYPVTSIESVKYDDDSNVEQTLVANTDYWATTTGRRARVTPINSWPSTYSNKPEVVRIRFYAGKTNDETLPADVKHAILVMVKEMFDNGAESIIGREVHMLPNTVRSLLENHRLIRL